MVKKISALILLLFSLSAMTEETLLEVIPLFNRPANELQPLIAPLLTEGDSVTGRDFSLIVKTTPQRLEEIKKLVKKLDTAPTNLTIRVVQSKDKTAAELNAGAHVDVVIPLPNPAKTQGRINGRLQQSQHQFSSNNEQMLRVLEGQTAYLKVGSSQPVRSVTMYDYGYGQRAIASTVQYLETTTGFAVLPRLNGEEVLLEISPWSEQMQPSGVAQTQSVQTRVKTRLGEWVEIGTANEQSQTDGSGLFSVNQGRSQQTIHILLQVEKAL